jgi:hypothetical protein
LIEVGKGLNTIWSWDVDGFGEMKWREAFVKIEKNRLKSEVSLTDVLKTKDELGIVGNEFHGRKVLADASMGCCFHGSCI